MSASWARRDFRSVCWMRRNSPPIRWRFRNPSRFKDVVDALEQESEARQGAGNDGKST
jgi:hypothetical protein